MGVTKKEFHAVIIYAKGRKMQVEDEVTRFNTLKIQENMDEEVALLAGVRVQIKISIKTKIEVIILVVIGLKR